MPARAMTRMTRLAAVVAAALLVVGPITESATAATAKEKALRRMINAYREEKDRKPLKMSATLVTKAHKQAKKMAADGRFDPVADHSSAAQLKNYAEAANCASLAENITSTIGTSDHTLGKIMDLWKSSSVHNANLLKKTWKKIGTGVFTDDKGRLWAVALFCDPL